MWDQMFRRWIDLVFWWMPRENRAAVQKDETAAPQNAEPRGSAAPRDAPRRVADDLTVIKGIGPAVQKKLIGLDNKTLSDLAEADPDALKDKLKGSQPISAAQVRAWTKAAGERAQS
jgi:large subunit ribosomal protein L21